MRPLGKAGILKLVNMKVSQRRFEYLKKELESIRSCIALLEVRTQRIKSVTLVLAILTPMLALVSILQLKARKGTSSGSLLNNGEHQDRKASTCVLTKNLADILEISSPVGMFSVTSTGVPTPKRPFCYPARVSALTKGAIVSKFLGYLYSSRGRREAEVIEFDYLLPARSWNAVFHFDFTTTGQQKTLEFGVSDSFVGMFSYPEKSGIGKLSYPWDLSCYPEWNRVKAADLSEAGAVHRDLMITASSTQPSLGILVALKQADEVLRQDRNTQARTYGNQQQAF
jgi:hypothetical protein